MTATSVEKLISADVGNLESDRSNITAVMRRAADGDMRAWDRLVDQYGRLIWSIPVRFKLEESDAADVVQTTWMRFIEHIDRIEQPDRVGSWLAATARNECLRHMAARKRLVLVHEDQEFDSVDYGPEVDEALLAAERAQAVQDALAHLPSQCQQLLKLLMADPPVTYAEISDQLGLPVGSIGPTRRRCLAKLRTLLEASAFGTKSLAAARQTSGGLRLSFREEMR
jgi:RNA polymerase sigma factor (sigma-70 family)